VLCCVGGGPASIPALKVVAPFCLFFCFCFCFCFCLCCCLERGSFVYLGRNNNSVRFDSIWHPTRTSLPLNTSLNLHPHPYLPKLRLDSGQRPIKNTFLPHPSAFLLPNPSHHIRINNKEQSHPSQSLHNNSIWLDSFLPIF
jgi:hypothetical protein